MVSSIITLLGPYKKYMIYAGLILVAMLYLGYMSNKIDSLENKNALLNSSLQSREVELNELKKDYVVVNNKRQSLQQFKNKLNSEAKPKTLEDLNSKLNIMGEY